MKTIALALILLSSTGHAACRDRLRGDPAMRAATQQFHQDHAEVGQVSASIHDRPAPGVAQVRVEFSSYRDFRRYEVDYLVTWVGRQIVARAYGPAVPSSRLRGLALEHFRQKFVPYLDNPHEVRADEHVAGRDGSLFVLIHARVSDPDDPEVHVLAQVDRRDVRRMYAGRRWVPGQSHDPVLEALEREMPGAEEAFAFSVHADKTGVTRFVLTRTKGQAPELFVAKEKSGNVISFARK